MNYSELKRAVIDDTHRADLSAFVPRFIEEAEGMIRRDLIAYPLSIALTNTEHVADGVYMISERITRIRRLALQGAERTGLQQMALASINGVSRNYRPIHFGLLSESQIVIRGVPSEDDVFDLDFFGLPAPLVNDSDTNALLTDHHALYLNAAKFRLYLHAQERSLADDEKGLFDMDIKALNKLAERQTGSPISTPLYQFTRRSSY